jgi:hypothetical protein
MHFPGFINLSAIATCLLLGACVPGPGYNNGYHNGYDNGYQDQRRPPQPSYDARQQAHERAAHEAQERHDQRVRELQHEYDKHQITERQLRDGIKEADREVSR